MDRKIPLGQHNADCVPLLNVAIGYGIKPKTVLEHWKIQIAKDAAESVGIAIDLFSKNYEVLMNRPAELKGFRSEVSKEAGEQIARQVVEKLVAMNVASFFAKQARLHNSRKSSNSRENKKGARKAPWRVHGLVLLKDGRRNLIDKSNNIIIDELINLGIIETRVDGSYWDAKAKPTKRCAKNEKAMKAAISRLVVEARN